jgi:transcriptional regulator with XRE-family HTH domain
MNSSMFPEISNQMNKRNEKLKDIANLLNLDISQISRKLSGKVEWTFKDVKILCNHYNMDFKKLFRGKED